MRASRQARKPVVTLKSSSIAFVNSKTREIEICNEETVQKDNSQHFAAKCCFCKSYKLIMGKNVFDNYNNRLLSYHVPPCCLRKRRWMKCFNLHHFHGTLVTFFFFRSWRKILRFLSVSFYKRPAYSVIENQDH